MRLWRKKNSFTIFENWKFDKNNNKNSKCVWPFPQPILSQGHRFPAILDKSLING